MEEMTLGPASPGLGSLGPALTLAPADGGKKLDPNSPPFYPSNSPANVASAGLTEEWSLCEEEAPAVKSTGYPAATAAAPDGTKGFRRPRVKSQSDAAAAPSTTILAACASMADAG